VEYNDEICFQATPQRICGEIERRKAMGYRFSLVLSREISEEESAILQEAGPASAVFGTDSLPTNAQVTVTKMDFDVTESPSLAEAIESALEAVKKVPELSVPGLTVPAQPAHAPEEGAASDPGVVVGTVVTDESASEAAPQETAAKADGSKPAAKKPRAARKAPAKKAAEEDKKQVEAGVAAE
jgi:hypothetical protein